MENEHLKFEVKSLKKDVTSQKTDFGSMVSNLTNLKERMETSNVEKILIVEDEPSPAKCQKCKSYPCLGVNLSLKKTLWRVQIFNKT